MSPSAPNNPAPQELPPPLFDHIGFTKFSKRQRAAATREMHKCIIEMVERARLLPLCGGDLIMLNGVLLKASESLRNEAFRLEARAQGDADLAGLPPPEQEPVPVDLDLMMADEPSGALADQIAADRLTRITDPLARPIIFIGRGIIPTYRDLVAKGDRVRTGTPPGGVVRGSEGRLHVEPMTVPFREPKGTALAPSSITTMPPAANEDHPTVPRPRPGPGPGRPYIGASVTPLEAGTGLHAARPEDYDRLIGDAIAQEGPVSIDIAIERVRDAHGLAAVKRNTRSKLESAATRLIQSGALVLSDGQFHDVAGRRPLARNRSGADERVRRVAAIPPVEMRAAIQEAAEAAEKVLPDELVVRAAGLLGFNVKRSSQAQLATALRAQVNAMVASGALLWEGDFVQARPEGGADPAHEPAAEEAISSSGLEPEGALLPGTNLDGVPPAEDEVHASDASASDKLTGGAGEF